MPKKKTVPPCPLCGTRHEDPTQALVHKLLGHGPLATGASPKKRKRVRTVLPGIFRRLETAGLDEVQAHQVVQIMAEELRKAGLV